MLLDQVLDRLINFFTSLRLTVVCLALALALVFWGTLAQVELGLYKAQNEFFRSFLIYWGPKGASWKGSAWKHYGGRGIRVCERWSLDADGFKNFLADMGRRPSLKHSIERNDVNGNYEPANCHWATRREQTRNTRRTIRIVVEGREVLLVDEVRARGLDYTTVFRRLQRGWDDARALTTPGRKAADAHPLPDARRQHRPGAGT